MRLPTHIELYDWPHVPREARELAKQYDVDEIAAVALVPNEMVDTWAYGLFEPIATFETCDGIWVYL